MNESMNALPVDSVFEAAVDPSGLLMVTVLLVIVDADSRALTRVPAVPSKASSWSSPAPEVTVTGAPPITIGLGDVPVTLPLSVPPLLVAVAVTVVVPGAEVNWPV
jgi:hypothetical protein